MWYAILFVQAITMASKDPKMSIQCTVWNRQNITLIIPLKLQIIGGSDVAQTEESLQFHKTLDRQQSATMANSDGLWHHEKMWKTFSSKRN